MSELVTLRCPNCSAPMEAGQSACSYCGGALYVGQPAEVALPAVADAQKIAAAMRVRVTANPYDGDAYYQLGLACYTLKLYEQAENAFRQAERFLPGAALPHYFVALSILYCGEEEILSIADFRLHQIQTELATALKIDPNLSDVAAYQSFVQGLRSRDEGDYEGALKPLKKAVAAMPTLSLAWKVLAACYFQLGQYDEAVQAGLRARPLRPLDEGNTYLIGAAYFRLGNQEQMEHYAHQVAGLRGNPDAWTQVLREYRGEFD